MHKILVLILFSIGISPIFAATPFFANDAFTQNGIEWCEENLPLYQILGNGFFEHHKHSIESRVCASLIEDPLWSYSGPDRIEKLIDKSRYFVQLEISESTQEAKTGVIDPTPAKSQEIFLEEKLQMSSPEQSETNELTINPEEESSNQNSTEGGGCLIATAAYGTELAPQVQQLRELRDNTILKTNSGSIFMIEFNQFYYSLSPIIADWEREVPIFRELVKLGITPMLASLSILNHVEIDSEYEMVGYGIIVMMLNFVIYFAPPTVILLKRKTIQKNLKFVH